MRRKSRFNSDDCILKKRKEIQGNKSKKKQGVMCYENMNIYLNTPEDAINFVSTVSKVPYEADLSYGHCMVDAKSILGVLGMAVRKKAKLTIYGEKNMDEVAKELKRYAA